MKSILIAITILTGLNLGAQNYEFEPDEMPGKIITDKGKELTGYIKLNGDERSPWDNQKSVEFFTEQAMEDGKVKGKEREKYKPKDIKAYVANGRYFESMKISAAKLSLGIGIDKWQFVERMVDGSTKLYRLYDYPDPVTVTTSEQERVEHEQQMESMRTEPNLVLQKGDGERELISKVDFVEYLSDCPKVREKYQSGGYGIEPWDTDKDSKIANWVASQVNLDKILAVLPEILDDYNSCEK